MITDAEIVLYIQTNYTLIYTHYYDIAKKYKEYELYFLKTDDNHRVKITYLKNGYKNTIRFTKYGELQSLDDIPSYIKYHKKNAICAIEYHYGGYMSRPNGPAGISYYNGIITYELYQCLKEHYINGVLYPASVRLQTAYYNTGIKSIEEWQDQINSYIIHYHGNGQKAKERWLEKNKLHRIEGPAIIEYTKTGKIKNTEFYLHNKKYSKPDFIQTPEYQAHLKQKAITIFD